MNAIAPETIVASTNAGALPESVLLLCAACGWPFAERGRGCVVMLESRRGGPPFYARVEEAADGGIIAWVDLASAARVVGDGSDAPACSLDAGPDLPACHQAVARLLAEVSTRIRLVRGIFRGVPGAPAPAFESRLASGSNAEQLADALAALSVACHFAGPEIQLLLSEPAIAEAYLIESDRTGGCSSGQRKTQEHACALESRS